MLRRLRSEAGYSLTELMVSLVVMAIALTFGVPPLASYMRQQQCLGAAEAIAGNYRLCRERAISEDAPVLASWSLTTGLLTAYVDRNENAGHDSDEPTVFTYQLPNALVLANDGEAAFAGTGVTFNSDGSSSESGILVVRLGEELSRRVHLIRATGLVKVTA